MLAPLLTDCYCLSAGVEIADGIPAPFPLVAHNPAAQPPRAPPRAPRQASRNTATHAFTTCLLSDKLLSPPPVSPPDLRSPVVISQHTAAAAAGASGPVPNQQNGTTDEGYEHAQGEHAHMHCNEQLDHGGHDENQVTQEQQDQQQQQHALGSASAEAETVEAPAQHSARSHSPDERSIHPQTAAEHPPQSQVSHLHSQSCEGFQKQQALPACQQAENPEAEPSMQRVPEPQGAPAALPDHVGPNHAAQVASEQHQQPQQRQQCGSFKCTPYTGASAANVQSQQQQQMPVGQVQHDQVAEQMRAPANPSPGSHPSASQQAGVPLNSDTAQAHTQAQTQAGVQEPGATSSPTAAATASLATQSPQRLHPLPLLDSALLAQLSRHAHSQSPDAAAHAPRHPMSDGERTRSVTPAASARAVVDQQPACVTPAAAHSALRNDCPDKPQEQMQPEAPPVSACNGLQQGQGRTSPAAALPASPGSIHQPDAPGPGSAQQLDAEQFEQDQLSQASSSESDEDFQPSEYEQDELSQPSSSSSDDEEEGDEDEDTFEVDELSQPESSSDEQSPVRAESGRSRVHSPSQAQLPHMVKSVPQHLSVSSDQSFGPQSGATAASGRSGVKCSRQGSLSADHKARLGFPKPAQPAKAVPVQKGYLTGNSLPFNRQTLPIDRGVKRPVQEVATQRGGPKRMRTMKSVNDVHKVSAREERRLDEEYELPAPAAQQVSHTWHNKQRT